MKEELYNEEKVTEEHNHGHECCCGEGHNDAGTGQCSCTCQDDAEHNGKAEELEDLDPVKLKHLLEEKTALAEENFNRLARLQADFENYRKRTLKEREDLAKFAGEQIIKAFLPILDNFDRALAYKGDDPVKVIEGVEMIHRQIHDVLSKEGLAPIPAVGEPFDPAKHEAVMQEETAEQPDNTVLEELQRGYFLKDRVIRPAMVKVARSI